jgi:hypothetical protein
VLNKGVRNIKASSGVKLSYLIPLAFCFVDLLWFAFLHKKQDERDIQLTVSLVHFQEHGVMQTYQEKS